MEWTYDANGTKLKKENSDGDVKHYVNGVEYDGSDFRGWETQKNGRTVQAVLNDIVEQTNLNLDVEREG